MRREDHRVETLQRVDAGIRRSELRVGRRDERGNHTGRLAVLDDALRGEFLNNADALLPQGIAQHAHDLHALLVAPTRLAKPALLDAHHYDPTERPLVGRRPTERLAESIDVPLLVVLDGTHGRARTRHHRIDVPDVRAVRIIQGYGHGWVSSTDNRPRARQATPRDTVRLERAKPQVVAD